MTGFLLVHGSRLGAWCWERAIGALERRGHAAVAVDLPIEDPEAGLSRYAAVATAAADGLDGPVVAVGHSLGGLVIALLPELLTVEELVFLCAPLPIPGVSLMARYEREPDMFLRANLPPRSLTAGSERSAESAIAAFFHDCADDVAQAAVERLRPQAPRPLEEPYPAAAWPPEVPCRYVLCRGDRIVNPAWARREVPFTLGVRPIELAGGHSPFLSRPEALADMLCREGVPA